MGDWLLAAAIGFVSGVLSGAFGIGGGIVTTPAVRLILGVPALVAVGTPLPVIIPTAITGAISYHRNGVGDVRSGVTIGLAGAATAVLGAFLAREVGGEIVLVATAALVIWAAGDTLLQVFRPVVPRSGGASESRPHAWVLAGIGLLAGLYSGFFGLGGGFVIVPMLTRFARVSVKTAIAISLVAVALLAIPGTITHAYLGNIDWLLAAGLALGVVPGAMLGARLTLFAADRSVRIGFAVLLIAAAVWLAASEIGALLT